jgi:hypothetical protein
VLGAFDEGAVPARRAEIAVSAVPADAHALPDEPVVNAGANGIDDAGHLMAGDDFNPG